MKKKATSVGTHWSSRGGMADSSGFHDFHSVRKHAEETLKGMVAGDSYTANQDLNLSFEDGGRERTMRSLLSFEKVDGIRYKVTGTLVEPQVLALISSFARAG